MKINSKKVINKKTYFKVSIIQSNYLVKGIFYQKMKILSSFTHPQVVPNLYEFLCSAKHNRRYFEESLQPGFFGAPLTSIVGNIKYYGSQWSPRSAMFPTFFRMSSYVFCRTKTFIKV